MRPLPYPDTDYTGKTCIVTGANVGLGKEAARHFCRLGANKVILACRDLEKGREAKTDIETSTERKGVVDVWKLDLASFQSVMDFCQQANTELERIDVVIENAGIAIGTYVEVDGGFESSIGINVVSTFLMAFLLLPKLRKTAMRFNVEPRLVVVSSDAHMFVCILPLASCRRAERSLNTAATLDTDVSRPNLAKELRDKSLRPLKASKT